MEGKGGGREGIEGIEGIEGKKIINNKKKDNKKKKKERRNFNNYLPIGIQIPPYQFQSGYLPSTLYTSTIRRRKRRLSYVDKLLQLNQCVMPLKIQLQTYRWLHSIGVLKNSVAACSEISGTIQINYDQQNYFRNGYLISLILKKFVEPYGQEYQGLGRVRKITVIRESQNWTILEQYLQRIGCYVLLDKPTEDAPISESDIQQILEYLMTKYGPKEPKLRVLKKGCKKELDFNNFSPQKALEEAENSLQLLCMFLTHSFSMPLSNALGLLMDRSKYLKKLMVFGSQVDDYASVLVLLELMIKNWSHVLEKVGDKGEDLHYVLEGVSEGVMSECERVCTLTMGLLSRVGHAEWWLEVGYFKLLQSPRTECFNFIIDKVKPQYELVFNERLHERVSSRTQLFRIFRNLIAALPKTIYCRDILAQVPIAYICQQLFAVMGLEEVDSQPQQVILEGRELLCAILSTFPDKMPSDALPRTIELFSYQQSRLHWDHAHVLSQLLGAVESLLVRESPLICQLFKVVMKYLQQTTGAIRHWIIHNLVQLYRSHGSQFPRACFLKMYPFATVCQDDEYSIFELIVEDQNLTEEDVEMALSIMSHYVSHQLHGKCFILLMEKLLRSKGQLGIRWAATTLESTASKLAKMKIPVLDDHHTVFNPIKPNPNKVVQSIGLKRKEMLKVSEFQLCRSLLYLLLNIRDRDFSHHYAHTISSNLNRLQLEIGAKKNTLIGLYKDLSKQIKKVEDSIVEGPTMGQLVQGAIMSKSMRGVVRGESQLVNSEYSLLSSAGDCSARIQEKGWEESGHNQFLAPDASESGNEAQSEESFLLPFSSAQSHQNCLTFYHNHLLEQHQIAYIKIAKKKNERIIAMCTQLFEQISQKERDLGQRISEFLNTLKLHSVVTKQSNIEEMFLKCTVFKAEPQEIMGNFLIQLAFTIFDFKTNRRVTINCVQSMFLYLRELLASQSGCISPQTASKLEQRIIFEPLISGRIFMGRKNSYLICYQALNEIFQSAFSIDLIEPISKQISSFRQHHQSTQEAEPLDSQFGQLQQAERGFQDTARRLEKTVDPQLRNAKLKKHKEEKMEEKVEEKEKMKEKVKDKMEDKMKEKVKVKEKEKVKMEESKNEDKAGERKGYDSKRALKGVIEERMKILSKELQIKKKKANKVLDTEVKELEENIHQDISQ